LPNLGRRRFDVQRVRGRGPSYLPVLRSLGPCPHRRALRPPPKLPHNQRGPPPHPAVRRVRHMTSPPDPCILATTRPPSTSGPGHHPLKVAARVRIPLGALLYAYECCTCIFGD